MAISVEMHNTGDPPLRTEVAMAIEHVLSQKSGDWRIIILGSQANDQWEMKITGPNAFERSYTLEGTAGQHDPQVIRGIVARMVSGTDMRRKSETPDRPGRNLSLTAWTRARTECELPSKHHSEIEDGEAGSPA